MDWTKIKHFTADEFACPCCDKVWIKDKLVLMLLAARIIARTPFIITSACRCEGYNAQLPGASKNSSHVRGYAVDIACVDGAKRERILHGLIKAGFRRIGIAKTFIHVDIDPLKHTGVWGMACLAIIPNLEILEQIKTYDNNNFKNGQLIDYIIIVEGGSLPDIVTTNEAGEDTVKDPVEVLNNIFQDARTNNKSHGTALIETPEGTGKIRLERLREQSPDGGWLKLKKDLRDGIFAYHGVPPRVVSQAVAGQLGGDNNGDMLLFYNFKVKPLQNHLARLLACEFGKEFEATYSPDVFAFGDLTEIFASENEKVFKQLNRHK